MSTPRPREMHTYAHQEAYTSYKNIHSSTLFEPKLETTQMSNVQLYCAIVFIEQNTV